jgi:hypothetical protein
MLTKKGGINMKPLDKIKSLQDQLVAMETKEIRKYLEVKKTIDALRSEVRKEMTSQLIIKPNGFGIPKTMKSWTDSNMIDALVSKDRKSVSGVIKGNKALALVKLSHRSPFEVKASTMLKIVGWS